MVLCPGTPEGSTGSGSDFKASQKTEPRLKVSSDRLGEAGIERAKHGSQGKTTFCGFSMSSYQYRAGKVYGLCVYQYDGSTRRLNRNCFYVEAGN